MPFAGLLLVSRPASLWSIASLLVALGVSLGLMSLSRGIASQTANAFATFQAGGFIIQRHRRSDLDRALRALGLAAGVMVLWCVVWGITWSEIELALTRHWWAWCRNLSAAAYLLDLSTSVRDFLDRLANGAGTYARIYPFWLGATGLMGLLLASYWHRRVTGNANNP